MTTKGVPYSWEISQPDGNDEGTDISRYSSLGAPGYYHLDPPVYLVLTTACCCAVVILNIYNDDSHLERKKC